MSFLRGDNLDIEKWIFLTRQEALDAIAIDFRQYGPQPGLFRLLGPLMLGSRFETIAPDGTARIRSGRQYRQVAPAQMDFYFLHLLETEPVSLPVLADICSLVFRTRTRAAESGIRIENQMDRFVCRQCGACCQRLGYEDDCFEEDVRRWEFLGRTDILAWVARDEAPGRPYRIWIDPVTGRAADGCPWLKRSGSRSVCAIQDVKPEVCRQYPLTRKHAAMTGCRGEFLPADACPDAAPAVCQLKKEPSQVS